MAHDAKESGRGESGRGVSPRLKGNSAAGRRNHLVHSAAGRRGYLGDFSRASRLMPWVVGVIALLVYMGTMSPGMQMGDGTELAAAAHVLGVPHPTGYPLYMLLTKLWLVLTVGGEVITRTTLLNCVLMAGAAGLTSVIVRDLLRVVWGAAVSKPMLWLAGLTGLLTAFLRFHWENAVVTEVYALQFLLTLVFVRIVQKMDLAGGPTRRGLLWLTVVFALAMAHHRLSVTLILPWLGVWVWAWRGRVGRLGGGDGSYGLDGSDESDGTYGCYGADGRECQGDRLDDRAARRSDGRVARRSDGRVAFGLPWLWAGVILLAGASIYLYIPLRAAQQPPVNWGNVTSASAFYHHVRGTEYLDRALLKPGLEQKFSASAAREFIAGQSYQIIRDLARQIVDDTSTGNHAVPSNPASWFLTKHAEALFGFIYFFGAVFGYWKIWRGGGGVLVIIVAAVALQNMAVLYAYTIADIQDYYLYPFWTMNTGVFVALISISANRPFRQLYQVVVMGAIVLMIFFNNYSHVDRSNDLSAELLSATILPEDNAVMPPGSILITDDDSETFTTWYRQYVRGERLDVLNFAGNFVYMPWYLAFFTPQQIADYQVTLAPAVARSAAEYAQQLRDAIIDKNVASRAVFTSINDPAVLMEWTGAYDVEPVDAVEITHRMFSDEPTTTVLYRISPKEPAAK